MSNTTKLKKVIYQFDLLRVSPSNAGSLFEATLKQNFHCGVQTGIVLGLSPCKKTAYGKSQEVTFTARTSMVMSGNQDDKFNEHLIGARNHQVQLMWLRVLKKIDLDLNLKQISHPDHLVQCLPHFNQQKWLRLLNDFALNNELKSPHSLFKKGEMRYSNQDLTVNYSEDRPDFFILQVNLGTLPSSFPDSMKQSIYKSMLQANHNSSMVSGVSWSLDPKTDSVVISFEIPVWNSRQACQPIDAEEFGKLIKNYIQMSQETWMEVLSLHSYTTSRSEADFVNNALPEELALIRPSWSEIH